MHTPHRLPDPGEHAIVLLELVHGNIHEAVRIAHENGFSTDNPYWFDVAAFLIGAAHA
jgi:hypothetical protein